MGTLDFSILAVNNITPFSPSVGVLTLPYAIQSAEEAKKLTMGEVGKELTENTLRNANVRIVFIGMFMETLAAIMILVPVLLPVMYGMGADPTHVGIVVICTLSIGFQTPPLGENLFVASGIGGEPVERIVAKIHPFVIISIIAVLLIAFFPQISLWLPKTLGY